jgi:hypothetical protein
MAQAEETVPFQLVASGHRSQHDQPQLLIFRSQRAWREHWTRAHQGFELISCPEPDLSDSMLIEVAGGATPSGSISVKVTSMVLREEVLEVRAAKHRPDGGRRDIGAPYAVVATPIWDGRVALDLTAEGHWPQLEEPWHHEVGPGQ